MKFTPEDFRLQNESLDPGQSVAYLLADKANAKLEQWLAEAPTVYSFKGMRETVWHPHQVGGDSHTAKLVCIEEIRK